MGGAPSLGGSGGGSVLTLILIGLVTLGTVLKLSESLLVCHLRETRVPTLGYGHEIQKQKPGKARPGCLPVGPLESVHRLRRGRAGLGAPPQGKGGRVRGPRMPTLCSPSIRNEGIHPKGQSVRGRV